MQDYWLGRYRRDLPAEETLSGLVVTALEARLDHPEAWAEFVRKVKERRASRPHT